MTAVPGWDIGGPGRTDAELARAAAADRRAFAGIYDRYANRLHDFCVGMLGDRDASADCVQDAFCTAATCLGDLRDPDKLRPWLYAVARNEALRRLRDRRRERPCDELPEVVSREAGPDVLAGRMELASLGREVHDPDAQTHRPPYRVLPRFRAGTPPPGLVAWGAGSAGGGVGNCRPSAAAHPAAAKGAYMREACWRAGAHTVGHT